MKYPSVYHLPWSPHFMEEMNEEVCLADVPFLNGQQVVITEKLDGENTSFHHDRVHARSENSVSRDYQTYVKNLQGRISHLIPEWMQIFGENVFAKHSIAYPELSDFYYVFMIYNKEVEVILSWEATIHWCDELGLSMAPVLFIGENFVNRFEFDNSKSKFGDKIEGYAVRPTSRFFLEDFHKSVAKWVRPNHIQTDVHWTKTWTKNRIKK